MASVIEIYRRTYNKTNKKKEGDVLGLVRVLYPDIEYNTSTAEKLLNTGKEKGNNK